MRIFYGSASLTIVLGYIGSQRVFEAAYLYEIGASSYSECYPCLETVAELTKWSKRRRDRVYPCP